MSTRIEEVKKQLSSESEQERLAALSETLNYGQQGLELLIEQSIKDQSDRVKQFAYRVFRGDSCCLRENTPESLIPSPTDVITSLAISPGNSILVGGSWKKIWVWNLQTGEIIRSIEGHSHWVLSVAISPDGNTLVSGSADKNIKVWNLKTGQLIHTLIDLSWHSSWVTAVAIAPDGKTIVSGSTNKTIKIWDLNTGKLNETLQDPKELSSVLSLCISHDGKVIACGSTNNKITLWNLDSGKLIRSIEGHSAWIQSLIITSDNTTLISGSRDGVVKFWQSKSGEQSSNQSGSALGKGLVDVAATVAGFSLGGPIAVGAWVLGRIIVAAADNGGVSVLPLQNLECTKTYPNNQSINSLGCNINQNILVVGVSREIKIFDLRYNYNKVIYTLPEQPDFISSVAVSPNGKTLAVAGKDWVTLLEPQTGKPLHAIKGCSYPKLSKIVIHEISQALTCGQVQYFTVQGLDQNNRDINLNDKDVEWETTGGKIKQGLFTAGEREGRFEVKAKIGIFETSVTITIIQPPRITEISVTPSRITLEFGKTQQFTAQVLDQRRNPMPETVLWEVSGGGTIDQNGNFVAGSDRGKFEIIASVSSIRRVIPITIIEPPKLTELIIISSTSQLEFGQSFQFQVKGVDQYGDSIQTGRITWSTSSGGGIIDQTGYFIAVNKQGNFEVIASVSSIRRVIPITIIEPPRLAELIITSSIPQLEFDQSFQFEVKGVDQYGNNIQAGKVTWSAISGNIDNRGVFYAGDREDTVIIKASVGRINTCTEVKVYEPSRLTFIEILPSSVTLEPGESQKFNVVALNQRGEEISVSNIEWNATEGLIDRHGNFCSGEQQKGACQVTVNVGHLSANAEVTVTPVLRGLKISPEQVEIKPDESFTFTVTGFDQVGDPLEITNVRWNSTTGGLITNKGAFKGDYQKREVTVTAKLGKLSDTAKVILLPVLRRLEVQPGFVYLKSSEQQTFVVKGLDQFGFSLAPGEVDWETTGGEIAQDGTLNFTQNEQGYFQVTATSQLAPKYTQDIRKLFLYTGISSRIISYLISYEMLLQEIFSLDSGSTDTEEKLDNAIVDETQELDISTDKFEAIQETDTIVEADEQLDIEVDQTTDIDTIVDPNVLDFYTALEGWFWKKLQKLVARVFLSISRFCLSEASANLSASADVFVLAVKYNPYKCFKCLNVLNGHFDNDFDFDFHFDRYHGYYRYHELIHTSLAITPDGQRLVSSGYWDDSIKIWNLNTGELISTLEAPQHYINPIAITPDGQTLVSGANNTIKIWDLKTNELLHSLHYSDSVYLVAITPDGKKFISVEDNNIIQTWDLNNQEILKAFYIDWSNTNRIVISPDGQRIIVGSEKIIKSYDLITGKLRTIIGCDLGWIYALAITPDGKTLITSHNNNTIKIWDLTKESPGVRLSLKSSAIVRTLTLTPDSQRIVSVGYDDDDYESFIEIWDLNTGEKFHSIEEYFSSHIEEHFIDHIKESSVAQVRCLAFSILRERGLDPTPSLVMQVMKVLQAMDSGILSHRKSHRTPSLAIAIQVVQEYLKEYFSRANRVSCLAITPDGKQIISSHCDGTIRIWGIPELSL
ncbi:Ig-like domain-containing protein [Microcoleus sp. B7-D4]|uniref:Ig-like domain-containing protein n=1 Tax=Microcoleus sp. B7-D4 TaxID=2818696 RepID=UPI002FD16C94